MKGRSHHGERLNPRGSGEEIEHRAIAAAESGRTAEMEAEERARGGGIRWKRRGGKVDGKKPARRIDRRARASNLTAGAEPSYRGPRKPEMPFTGAEAHDVPVTHETNPKEQPDRYARGGACEESEEERAKGGGVHIKPSHRGRLHRDLGIPEGKPIPMAKKLAAKKSPNPRIRKEANFAVNFGHGKR